LYVNVLVYKTAYSTLRKATWPIQAIKDIGKNAWYPLSIIKDIKTQHGKKKMQILLCQIENVSLTWPVWYL
jgi:hypothetical protein